MTGKIERYEAACERVRRLLQHWLESGIDLFLELRKVESSRLWEVGGHSTFSEFLKREFPNAIGIDHYQRVSRAIDVHGLEFVKKLGVHASLAASTKAVIEHPERVRRLQETVTKHIRDKQVPPEVHEVKRMVRVIAPETSPLPKEPVRAVRAQRPPRTEVVPVGPEKIDELQQAQARIKQLEARVRELEEELRRYKPTKPPGTKLTWS